MFLCNVLCMVVEITADVALQPVSMLSSAISFDPEPRRRGHTRVHSGQLTPVAKRNSRICCYPVGKEYFVCDTRETMKHFVLGVHLKEAFA